ncbi:MAG: hypothetical protein KZQ99_01645 [Candidatus Thiodiazotropha sp. (ex Dulcina madagascariensis)]|nr:hypothetical protein [Candidatus Thiodiazotropha sp. (ex Dulcina madagascariensis)]
MIRYPVERLCLLLLWAGPALLPADERSAGAKELPEMELLEFLGGWNTPQGDWFDPLQLADEEPQHRDSMVPDNDD